MLQYSLVRCSDGREILLAASEVAVVRMDDAEPATCVTRDDLQADAGMEDIIAYGAYLQNPTASVTDAVGVVNEAIGYGLGFVTETQPSALRCIELADLEPGKLINRGSQRLLPFAARLRVSPGSALPWKRRWTIPAFLRYGNLSPRENILVRDGIFALTAPERRHRGPEQWRDAIDMKRAVRLAYQIA